MTADVEKNKNNSEKSAPEGGYGYVISVALCVNFICVYSHQNSFGLLFHDVLSNHGDEAGSLSKIMTYLMIMMTISGFLVNAALKKYSIRQVALFTSIIYTAAWFSNYFITKIYLLYVTCGVIQGFTMAVLTTVTYTSFNSYFVEKRLMVISICQIVIGIGTMIFPLLLESLMNTYGFKGTILIMSGLFAHTIVSALAFHPVEWHTKKEHVYLEVIQNADDTRQTHETIIDSGKKYENKVNIPTDEENKRSDVNHKKSDSFWKSVSDQMDLSLLRNVIYLNITLGMTVTWACDLIFILFYPKYLYSIGFSTHEVATLLSTVSAADLLSRTVLAFISYLYSIPSRNVFFICGIGIVVFKTLFLSCSSYWLIILTSFMVGLFRGPLQVTFPIVYAEVYGVKFPSACGLSYLFLGSINTIILPIMNAIYESTNSFTITFNILNILSAAFFIPWCYEYWFYKKD